MSSSLTALSAILTETVAKLAESVVTVHARPRVTSSGFAWSKGVIVTAAHALAREEEISITLPDGTRTAAKLLAADPATDIALLGHDVDLPTLGGATAFEGRPGELLIAVGRNADTGATASMGILSAAGGAWRTWRGGQMERFLRLDLSLFPGSVGGVVASVDGRFAGMASDALSRLSPLAVPPETLARVVPALLERGRVPRPFLGVGLQPVAVNDSRGVILLSVDADSAAAKAGLLVGDVITELDGKAVADADDVQAVLDKHLPGDALPARVVRAGKLIEWTVTLGERAAA